MDDPPESLLPADQLASLVTGLEHAGFKSVVDYTEAHGRLVKMSSFVVAMKDNDSRTNWFMSEAEINLKISKRTMRTKTGESPFLFFDGASMMQYQFSSRVAEEVWCRDKPDICSAGHGYAPEKASVPVSSLEVRPSVIAKGGRGLFASEFIPKGTVIGLEDCVNGMFLSGTTYRLMNEAADMFNDTVSEFIDTLSRGYVYGYGWDSFEYVRFVGCDCDRAVICLLEYELTDLTAPGAACRWSGPRNHDVRKPRLQRNLQHRHSFGNDRNDDGARSRPRRSTR